MHGKVVTYLCWYVFTNKVHVFTFKVLIFNCGIAFGQISVQNAQNETMHIIQTSDLHVSYFPPKLLDVLKSFT